jgi:hypothetical protein
MNKPAERVGARHVKPSRSKEPALEFRDWLVPIPDTITYESKDGVLETGCLFARASRARFFSRGLGRPFSFFSLRDQPTGELVFLDYEVPMLEQQEELLISIARSHRGSERLIRQTATGNDQPS